MPSLRDTCGTLGEVLDDPPQQQRSNKPRSAVVIAGHPRPHGRAGQGWDVESFPWFRADDATSAPSAEIVHVSTVAARAPTASLRDGASATLAPTAPTSNTARTRGTRGSADPSARLPSHGTGTERRSRVASVCVLFALVTGDSRSAAWILRKD
jgi:hypothetical protein